MSEDLIMGRNTVLEALRSKRDIHKIWVAEGATKGQIQQVIAVAKENKIMIQTAAE